MKFQDALLKARDYGGIVAHMPVQIWKEDAYPVDKTKRPPAPDFIVALREYYNNEILQVPTRLLFDEWWFPWHGRWTIRRKAANA